MKTNRDAAVLAASLTQAANTPLPLPQTSVIQAPSGVVAEPAPEPTLAALTRKPRKLKLVTETVGMTLRPDRELLNQYTMAAAERTKKEGKVISAQQIMLEVLERHKPVKS
jgi:hypothetical protein